MKTNTAAKNHARTYEGAPAIKISPEKELRRAVLSCLLWENSFYESGEEIADRIKKLVFQLKDRPKLVADLAVEAKQKHGLRHVPLLLAVELAGVHKGDRLLQDTVFEIVTRVDDIPELISIYWKNGKKPISAQIKKGLARAFDKFDEYQFAKYDRDSAIKLRDVMFLVHPKPKDKDALFKSIAERTLKTPDTWEVSLSGGADKRETFERLIKEEKLGDLAFIRNLRNMSEAKVDFGVIKERFLKIKTGRIFPFQYIAAAKYVPQFENLIEPVLLRANEGKPRLAGTTGILVDVSGSMDDKLSSKGEMTRMDAACGLAMIIRDLAQDVEIFSFSNSIAVIPARRGFALRDAIVSSQPHSGTALGAAINTLREKKKYDRFIVITDEQSNDSVGAGAGELNYMLNVGQYKPSVGYGAWTRIDGFSEHTVRFMQEIETKGDR